MFTHTNFLKAFILSISLTLLLTFNCKASSNERFNDAENTVEHHSKVKNKTIGSWWMWATGSGLIVLLIFAFSKEEEGISFNK
ncbi:MAG TPA: hypothetical protein VF691_01945 [Cytophagaceae bacterium]|jgi:hypothetical protein